MANAGDLESITGAVDCEARGLDRQLGCLLLIGAGWEFVHIAIDQASRQVFSGIIADE